MATQISNQEFASATGTTPLKAWLPSLVGVVIACGVFGVVFQREISGAIRVWIDSTAYNHGFLVLPLTAILVWMRRNVISQMRPSPAPCFLILLPIITAVWLVATFLDVLEAEQLLVVTMFQALLLAMLGWSVFRALLAPILFLFFLVPFGAFLVPVLQRFTADFAADGLRLLGIPVFADGFMIQIPAGNFEVAEACAGLRFLIASLVFGCFYATVVYRSKIRRLVFICFAVLIPIVANGLRALGLILIAHALGSSSAVDADHVIYGWVFFTFVILLLIAVGMIFADVPDEVSNANESDAVARSKLGWADLSPKRLVLTASIGLLLVALGPAWLMISEPAAAAPLRLGLPGIIASEPWLPVCDEGKACDQGNDWYPVVDGARDLRPAAYRDGAVIVSVWGVEYPFSARKPLTRSIKNIADPAVWEVVERGSTSVPLGEQSVVVNTVMLRREQHFRSVWWFYVIEGRIIASKLQARLLQALNLLSGGEHKVAFVAISSMTDGAANPNPNLVRFLNSVRPRFIND